jgi:signal peptidase I
MRFSEILFIVTIVTGMICLFDFLVLSRRRSANWTSSLLGKNKKEPWWIEYSKAFFPILLIVFILRSFVAEPFRIPSGSMRPTLLEGDFIVVGKYNYGLRLPLLDIKLWEVGTPKRGDIIVFKHVKNGESIDMIKRVVGLPHDHIEYKNNKIYINGEPIKEEFLREKIDKSNLGAENAVREFSEELGSVKYNIYVQANSLQPPVPYVYDNVMVPANAYFVVGDNRDNSGDSRFWGFVKDEDVEGKALAIWMSLDFEHYQIRWNRLGGLYSSKE